MSRTMGQGHVCVSFSDVLTPHQMTDVLELENSKHLLKCSVEWTDQPLISLPNSDERVGARKAPKQLICHCTDSSQILSFELISNYSACIVQIKGKKISRDI